MTRPGGTASPESGAPARSLGERMRDLRGRLVASPAFRHFAALFPLTRPVARRHTAALFDLCAGFVYSQVLSAFVRLGLVEHLAAGPRDAAEIAALTGLSEPAADRLLRAAVALGLAERRAGARYGLGMNGAALVGNDGVRALIEHHAILYADLADPVALLRGDTKPRLGAFWDYRGGDAEAAASYSRLMAASQDFIARQILDAMPLARARLLLDVGGGAGAFVEAALRRHPALRAILFDLPPVAALARDRLSGAGLAHRVTIAAGSFHADPLPRGADVATLVRVLHDHDDDDALALLKAVRAALPAGGRLIVAEPMAETPGAEAAGDAYFGFYLLAMGRGRPRAFGEIAAMARQAGFGSVRAVPTATPLLVRLALATG